MTKQLVIGVDVSCAVKKRIPIVFAEKREGRLIPLPVKELPFAAPYGHGNKLVVEHEYNLNYARQIREYITDVCHFYGATPERIGIDSPLRPRSSALDYRIAERELNQAGIRCYKTPSKPEFDEIIHKVRHHLTTGGAISRVPHAMQLWMLAGFEIARELATIARGSRGVPAGEYPSINAKRTAQKWQRCATTTTRSNCPPYRLASFADGMDAVKAN